MTKIKYTFIDLFAGCGGLSEGSVQDGWRVLLVIEKCLCHRNFLIDNKINT